MRRKLILALLLAAVVTGTAHAALAPLSPEFLKWREQQRNSVSIAGEAEGTSRYGYRPSPLNLAHLASNPPRLAEATTPLPTKFDLRNWNVVPPVRSQGEWGTCWSFGTMAAVETNYLMQLTGHAVTKYITAPIDSIGSTPDKVDLSEMHVAWFSYMGPTMEQRLTAAEAKNIRNPSPSEALNNGGFVSTSIQTLARGWSPVTEDACRYISNFVDVNAIKFAFAAKMFGSSAETLEDLNNLIDNLSEADQKSFNDAVNAEVARQTNEWCAANIAKKKPSDYTTVLRLRDASYVAETSERSLLMFKNREGIKRLVMDRGALAISYYAGGAVKNGAYYYTGSKEGHIVSIVGWDDDYPVENFTADNQGNARPQNPGAWLIRNSWGTDAPGHAEGYFWMSYEQTTRDGTAFTMAPVEEGLTLYTHSDLGWCESYGFDSTTCYGASVFKTGSNGVTLKEIGFYTTDNNASAEFSVYVYDEKPTAENLTTGQAVATVPVKTYDYAGYHTTALSSALSIGANKYFAIVQKAVNDSYKYPIATMARVKDYSEFAQIHDGEGYVSGNGTKWFDGAKEEKAVTPAIYAFVTGAAAGDDGEDDKDLTIDGVPVESLDDLNSALNVLESYNEALNPESARKGRSLTLTLAGTDGKPVEDGKEFILYLLYTNDLFYDDNASSSSRYGYREPSGEYVPLYPAGYKPDLFLEWDMTDVGIEDMAELPAYGPFRVTTSNGGRVTLNLDALVYDNLADNERAGTVAKIPAGYQDLYYYSVEDTANSPAGVVPDLQVTAGSGSSSGCNTGLFGGLSLALTVAVSLLMKRR